MNEKRIVVTGVGAVTALGMSASETWKNVKNGVSGVNTFQHIDCSDLPTQYGATIRSFDPLMYMDKKEVRKMDRFAQLCVATIREALEDSKLCLDDIDPYRIANIQGVGIGGMDSYSVGLEKFLQRGHKGVPIMNIPRIISNSGPANAAMLLGNIKGATYVVTTACASGTDAIGAAMKHLLFGEADVAIAGGSESTVTRYGIASFNVLHALSTRWKSEPQRASRPFDKERDGFVMGEGSATMILETLEHAQKRGASIYCELVGYASTCDAYHYTAPHPTGEGARRAIELVLEQAHVPSEEVDYINAHGTSTPMNDPIETRVIRDVFGEDSAQQPKVSSTKSMTGHCLGAAGAIEALACVFAITDSFIPPTINLETIEEDCQLNHVANVGVEEEVRCAMSNTFGFGGHNSVVVFKKYG